MRFPRFCLYVNVFKIRVFGELDFHPPNGFKFWELVETVLERRFHELPPREAIDLLLSFVYIERYPLNFVRRLFNPHFLDRLHEQDTADVAYSRAQLSLFDAVMCMEARNYGGPFLPKDSGSANVPMASMQVSFVFVFCVVKCFLYSVL